MGWMPGIIGAGPLSEDHRSRKVAGLLADEIGHLFGQAALVRGLYAVCDRKGDWDLTQKDQAFPGQRQFLISGPTWT